MLDDYTWTCPKCGFLVRSAGPASLAWAKSNHDYWKHVRDKDVAMPGGYTAPKQEPASDCLLFRGVAMLDDAFYDGARLTAFDFSFLSVFRVCWNSAK